MALYPAGVVPLRETKKRVSLIDPPSGGAPFADARAFRQATARVAARAIGRSVSGGAFRSSILRPAARHSPTLGPDGDSSTRANTKTLRAFQA
jgi:hypothetical protein